MGSRRWSFVEQAALRPSRPAWRFSLGYLATLAIVVAAVGLLMK